MMNDPFYSAVCWKYSIKQQGDNQIAHFTGLSSLFPDLMKSLMLSNPPPPPLELNKQIKTAAQHVSWQGYACPQLVSLHMYVCCSVIRLYLDRHHPWIVGRSLINCCIWQLQWLHPSCMPLWSSEVRQTHIIFTNDSTWTFVFIWKLF